MLIGGRCWIICNWINTGVVARDDVAVHICVAGAADAVAVATADFAAAESADTNPRADGAQPRSQRKKRTLHYTAC